MKCSMTGQEKSDLLTQVTVNRGDQKGRFDCIFLYSFENTHWVRCYC
jgi:hypothetical protein